MACPVVSVCLPTARSLGQLSFFCISFHTAPSHPSFPRVNTRIVLIECVLFIFQVAKMDWFLKHNGEVKNEVMLFCHDLVRLDTISSLEMHKRYFCTLRLLLWAGLLASRCVILN